MVMISISTKVELCLEISSSEIRDLLKGKQIRRSYSECTATNNENDEIDDILIYCEDPESFELSDD